MKRPAHFSHEQYTKAKEHLDDVRLAHLTVRDPETMSVISVEGIILKDTASALLDSFINAPKSDRQLELKLD